MAPIRIEIVRRREDRLQPGRLLAPARGVAELVVELEEDASVAQPCIQEIRRVVRKKVKP
jgi:hypothetical protein